MRFSDGLLHNLKIRKISIERVAKAKERDMITTGAALTALGFKIMDFRLWQDYEKERRRLIYLRDFGIFSTPEMEGRLKEHDN